MFSPNTEADGNDPSTHSSQEQSNASEEPSVLINFFLQNHTFFHSQIVGLPFHKNHLATLLKDKFSAPSSIESITLFRVQDPEDADEMENDNDEEEEEENNERTNLVEITGEGQIETEGIYECYIIVSESAIPKKRPIEEVNNSSGEESKEAKEFCEICRSEVEEATNYCVADDSHPSFCKACINGYIENKICTAFLGSCSIMYCPATYHQKRRKILNYKKWSSGVARNMEKQHKLLAKSLTQFQCAGCHLPGSLDLGYEANVGADCYMEIKAVLEDTIENASEIEDEGDNANEKAETATKSTAAETIEIVIADSKEVKMNPPVENPRRSLDDLLLFLNDYCAGDHSLDQTYAYIQQLFPTIVGVTDDEAWSIFSKVLKMIPDPERRSNIHLRYLRDHPRIRTLCCSHEHCFRCKTKGFHNGRSCSLTTEELDHSVVTCPSCGLALAKGDGCDTITCMCGKQFSWSVEKATSENSGKFLQVFPQDTSAKCAEILSERTGVIQTEVLIQAKAWQARNRIEVNRALSEHFKRKFWPCPSQCCAILSLQPPSDGIKQAIELWRNTHGKEVNRCKIENDTAVHSIFVNLYPSDKERVMTATRLLNGAKRALFPATDPKIMESANKWIEKNRGMYNRGLEEIEERSARQFLYLYGHYSINSIFPVACGSTVFHWDPELSNGSLTYTNDYTTAERVGSVSSRPALFARLTNVHSTMKIIIDKIGNTPSLLSFGLTPVASPKSDGDGIGRRNGSFGLTQDASPSVQTISIIQSAQLVASFRKLQVGDVVIMTVNLTDGSFQLSINEQEFSHTFAITPSANLSSYYFAATLAANYKITILEESSTPAKLATNPSETAEETPALPVAAAKQRISLNPDHSLMCNNFKRQLRLIIQENDDIMTRISSSMSASTVSTVKKSRIITYGLEWLTICGGNSKAAFEQFEAIKPEIERFLGISTSNSVGSAFSAAVSSSDIQISMLETNISMKTLLEAASWYHHNREAIQAELRTEFGLNFMLMHEDGACFVAASNLAEYHTHRVDKDEMVASIAYMEMFQDEMNAWYDYNATLQDPLVPNIAVGCRCLPRHVRTCPVIANRR
jgi:hypothetical protein